MRRAAPLAVLWVMSCGPHLATYEVDLVPESRCAIRAGQESCETPTGEQTTLTLTIEPRGDQLFLLLGERLFVSPQPADPLASDPLQATRVLEQIELETGCQRREVQALQVAVSGVEVDGALETEEQTTGPEAPCGPTPFGTRLRQALRGTEIEGP